MVVGGAALAREESGRVVFVSGAIAGETVDVRFTSGKKDFARAEVVAAVEASPDRVVPPCEAWHRGCGGCDWQHIDPAAQLRLKTEIVAEALRRTGRIESPVVEAAASVEPWGYRTTVRVAGRRDGRVGFRASRSHDVIAIDRCPISDHRINEVLAARSIDGRRAVDDDVMIRVGVEGDPVVVHDSERGDAGATDGVVHEVVDGQRLRVSAGSFFQSSPQAASLLVDAVSRLCADLDLAASRVVDAYGGIGLFGATVARDAAHLTVVELSRSSCADARHNLADRIAAGRADIVESAFEAWRTTPADLVIADPARSGLDRGGVEAAVSTGATVIVLVSCDAGSLARDARLLEGSGYRHRGTEVFDVFPNTSHIEAVTRFDRTPDDIGTDRNA